MRGFDWKWVGIGALIMLALSFVGGLLVALLWGDEVRQATQRETTDIALSGGQVAVAALIGFLSYAIGGYIVGVRSAGRTILEPAIAAAVAVVIGLLITGQFTVPNLVAGAVVPFLAGLLGGWLGERRQGGRIASSQF